MFSQAAIRIASKSQVRTFVSKSAIRQSGAHKTFEPPFDKRVVFACTWGLASVGVAIPILSIRFQNKKHGFTK